MTNTPIPDDVINVSFPIAVSLAGNVTDKVEASLVQLAAEHQIARAILADREAQAKRVEELERALREVSQNARRRDLHGNGALFDVIDPYVIDDARALLRSKEQEKRDA